MNYYTYGAIASASQTVVDFLARLMSHNSNTCSIWLLIKLLSVYAGIFQFALQTDVHASKYQKKLCAFDESDCLYIFLVSFPLFCHRLWARAMTIHTYCLYILNRPSLKKGHFRMFSEEAKTSQVKEMLSQHGSLMQYKSSENRNAF